MLLVQDFLLLKDTFIRYLPKNEKCYFTMLEIFKKFKILQIEKIEKIDEIKAEKKKGNPY